MLETSKDGIENEREQCLGCKHVEGMGEVAEHSSWNKKRKIPQFLQLDYADCLSLFSIEQCTLKGIVV